MIPSHITPIIDNTRYKQHSTHKKLNIDNPNEQFLVTPLQTPIRATYANLYKWPESDAAFVRSVSSNGRIEDERQKLHRHPSVVDSMSCRQMYLRSYTFTRKESVKERTKKCFVRVREKVSRNSALGKNKEMKKNKATYNVSGIDRVKGVSCSALLRVFGLLSCTSKVDVVD